MAVKLSERAQALIDSAKQTKPAAPLPAATAVALIAKESYTADRLIALLKAHPDYTQVQLAAHFGRTPGWLSLVITSDSFQLALEPHRDQIDNISVTSTLNDRFKALVLRSTEVLMERLDNEKVTDVVVFKAAELGIKALGLGAAVAPVEAPRAAHSSDDLAARLLELMDAKEAARTVRVQAKEKKHMAEATTVELKPAANVS